MAKVLDFDIVVNEFEFHSCYYIYFGTNTLGKRKNPIITPFAKIVSLLNFNKDIFGNK